MLLGLVQKKTPNHKAQAMASANDAKMLDGRPSGWPGGNDFGIGRIWRMRNWRRIWPAPTWYMNFADGQSLGETQDEQPTWLQVL